jgi:hypothetical protein
MRLPSIRHGVNVLSTLGWLASILWLAAVLTGCFENSASRNIAGEFYLEQRNEGSGLYYLQRSGERKTGGGFIGGTVQRIGWNKNTIVVKRLSTARSDTDGWLIIDVKTKALIGPSRRKSSWPDPTRKKFRLSRPTMRGRHFNLENNAHALEFWQHNGKRKW